MAELTVERRREIYTDGLRKRILKKPDGLFPVGDYSFTSAAIEELLEHAKKRIYFYAPDITHLLNEMACCRIVITLRYGVDVKVLSSQAFDTLTLNQQNALATNWKFTNSTIPQAFLIIDDNLFYMQFDKKSSFSGTICTNVTDDEASKAMLSVLVQTFEKCGTVKC